MEEGNEVVVVTNVCGDICIRKRARRKRQKLLVKELMYDYANNTTLHGLPYVTRTGLTLIEKIFWFVTFVASVSMCLFLISKVWYKWKTSPVIVTVSEQLVSVNEMPFPSITICPQSKCKQSKYNFTNEKLIVDEYMQKRRVAKFLNKDTYDGTINDTMKARIAKFASVSKICDFPNPYDLSDIFPSNHTNSSFVEDIIEVAPNYNDVFHACFVYGHYIENCESLFRMVLTSEGLCYNMNSLAAKEIFRMKNLQTDYEYLYATNVSRNWTVENGYSYVISKEVNHETIEEIEKEYSDTYPTRGRENGESPDVEVVLQHNKSDRDHLCNGLNSGFKVYIQHPTDLPQSSLYYYAVLNNQVSSMALSFTVLNTSESLRGYDPEVRQCYFHEERYLKYFSIYTASNCRIECLSNVTKHYCHCTAFYMPDDRSNRICTQIDDDCVKEARRIMQYQELAKEGSKRCHCLPACNTMDYDAEILKSEFNLKRLMETYYKTVSYSDGSYNSINFSKLEMYFKQPRFMSWRRSELFGLIDFLANCGGLLGLFLGFSFLSLVEIFYFLSLRLCCTLKKDLEEEKAQKKTEKEVYEYVEKY
ncbi:hypothetical protein PYW07_001894 [Mythimna separata]|uniref:Uncharacterized protein n=1 Tax=Mythimna separata TaxID=271217 RepID=A0AAD8DWA0_MYTSE|nr:hypothetical protein PYW07_001894 [Mythimna separata]